MLALVAAASAAPLLTAAPAQATVLGNPTGCHAWKESTTSGMGVCTAANRGKWRVGVSCTDRHYYYSQWTGYTEPRRARCGGGTLTPGVDPWIDTMET
ncbi:hypothetical protein DZF91_19165 [Actinomadura logoneensis]|uniref:Secreted protein n=2 Tax=Actinomadura logoneensis TaxID=2293572 RepID=A0A372JJK6_9ACTN|nr:hypothetical protein DZF91_19165 [Actinomadura logoneensis]